MDSFTRIILEEKEGIALLTLNNPENRNALTEDTKTEMISALGEIAHSGQIRALVITGKGDAFCAGGDVKNIGKDLSTTEIHEVMKKSQKLLHALLGLEKPVIASVNGDAFGTGCMLSVATDFPIASEKSRFSLAFVHLGVCPDFGTLYFLPRLVGLWKTKEMAYLGKAVSAAEALEMGLVYKVVPHGELQKEVMDLAARLSRMPTLAIGRMKRIINRTFDMPLNDVLSEEIKAQTDLTQTMDHREGVRAFHEKRRPQFQGK